MCFGLTHTWYHSLKSWLHDLREKNPNPHAAAPPSTNPTFDPHTSFNDPNLRQWPLPSRESCLFQWRYLKVIPTSASHHPCKSTTAQATTSVTPLGTPYATTWATTFVAPQQVPIQFSTFGFSVWMLKSCCDHDFFHLPQCVCSIFWFCGCSIIVLFSFVVVLFEIISL